PSVSAVASMEWYASTATAPRIANANQRPTNSRSFMVLRTVGPPSAGPQVHASTPVLSHGPSRQTRMRQAAPSAPAPPGEMPRRGTKFRAHRWPRASGTRAADESRNMTPDEISSPLRQQGRPNPPSHRPASLPRLQKRDGPVASSLHGDRLA